MVVPLFSLTKSLAEYLPDCRFGRFSSLDIAKTASPSLFVAQPSTVISALAGELKIVALLQVSSPPFSRRFSWVACFDAQADIAKRNESSKAKAIADAAFPFPFTSRSFLTQAFNFKISLCKVPQLPQHSYDAARFSNAI